MYIFWVLGTALIYKNLGRNFFRNYILANFISVKFKYNKCASTMHSKTHYLSKTNIQVLISYVMENYVPTYILYLCYF